MIKCSSNAIKFLLAQYRAIYKRAYIKGLVGAALVTLSVGASAATVPSIDESSNLIGYDTWANASKANDTTFNASGTISFSGGGASSSGKYFSILNLTSGTLNVEGYKTVGMMVTNKLEIANGATLTVGETARASIAGYDRGAENLGPDSDQATGTFVSRGETSLLNNSTIQMRNVELKSGSITNLTGNAADKWNEGAFIYGGFGDNTSTKGKFDIESGAQVTLSGSAHISTTTDITMNINGEVKMLGGTEANHGFIRATDTIQDGSDFGSSKSGELNFGKSASVIVGDGESNASGGIYSAKTTIDGATFTANSSGTLVFNGDLDKKSVTISNAGFAAGAFTMNSGEINVKSGGTVVFANVDDKRNTKALSGTTTFDVNYPRPKGHGLVTAQSY